MKVCVQVPWLVSWSMISRVTFAFVSAETEVHSFTSVARRAPSKVSGHTCFSTTGARFDCT